MSETNSTTTLQVRNPSIVVGITPIFTIFPSQILLVHNNLSPFTKGLIIGFDVIIALTALILLITLGTRKVDLILKHDGLTFYKRSFTLDQIEKITYSRRTRSLQVKVRPAMRSFNVYFGKKDEAPELENQMEQWVHQTGVSYLVK